MNKPEYIYIDADKMITHKDGNKTVKVIAGKFEDAEGPVKGHNVEPVYFDVEIEKGNKFNFNLPATHNSLIYLIEGEIKVGDKVHDVVKDSTLIILTRGEKLKVSSLTKAKFLLISGKPIGEPIARGGPFVMTVNFNTGTGTVSASSSTANTTLSGQFNVDASTGYFSGDDLALFAPNLQGSTTAVITGSFHGDGAVGVSGLYYDAGDNPLVNGAIIGSRDAR